MTAQTHWDSVNLPTPELFPWTRQITGRGYCHHAYVYSGNKAIRACEHRHRSQSAAQACAERLYRQELRKRAAVADPIKLSTPEELLKSFRYHMKQIPDDPENAFGNAIGGLYLDAQALQERVEELEDELATALTKTSMVSCSICGATTNCPHRYPGV